MNGGKRGGDGRAGGHPPAGGSGPYIDLRVGAEDSVLLYASLLLMARQAHIAHRAAGHESAALMQFSAIDLAERVASLADLGGDDLDDVRIWLDVVAPLPT